MSYPHLASETANECSRAAYDYDPACYCVFHWNYADFPPKRQYHGLWTKWLQVNVWRTIPDPEQDKLVLTRHSDNGPDLLRHLRTALAAITEGQLPDPSLPAPAPPAREPYNPPEGGGWIGSAPQTTQALNCWPS